MELLIHYTKDEFQQDLKQYIADAIKSLNPEEKASKTEYLTRYEISKEIHVSYPTLHRLDKEGILKAHKIGGRVLYLRSDVEKAVQQGQSLKYRRV